MRGSLLAVAARARPVLGGGSRYARETAHREATRPPRRVCRESRVTRSAARPDDPDGRPSRKSAQNPVLESWADEPETSGSRPNPSWDDAWDDAWDTSRSARSGAFRERPERLELDDDGRPKEASGTRRDDDVPRDDEDDDEKDSRRTPTDDDAAGAEPGSFFYRDRESSPRGGGFAESVPGAAGRAVSWTLKAVALVSDATASLLAPLFPRAIPRATLRTAAYFLWAAVLAAVFQKLLSTFVLVGGLALLAIAVASGEASRSASGESRGNFEKRRSGPSDGAWGSRNESFDAFVDRMERKKRDAFWGGAAKRSTHAMREFWTDIRGDDAYDAFDLSDGSSSASRGKGMGESRRRDGDRGSADHPAREWIPRAFRDSMDDHEFAPSDWSAAAAAAAAAATRAAAEAAGNAFDEVSSSVTSSTGTSSFDEKNARVDFDGGGAAAAAAAGFAFRSDELTPRETYSSSASDSRDSAVDVEAVSFDAWVGRRDEKETKTPYGLTDPVEPRFRTPRDAFENSREANGSSGDFFEREGRFSDFDSAARSFGSNSGYDRWTNASRTALDDAARRAADALGVERNRRGSNLGPAGSGTGGERKNRWREFLTGRFAGAFQEDLVRARFEGTFASDDDERPTDSPPEVYGAAGKTGNATFRDGRFVNGAWIGEASDGAGDGEGKTGPEDSAGGTTR